jgi:hypothetical protein
VNGRGNQVSQQPLASNAIEVELDGGSMNWNRKDDPGVWVLLGAFRQEAMCLRKEILGSVDLSTATERVVGVMRMERDCSMKVTALEELCSPVDYTFLLVLGIVCYFLTLENKEDSNFCPFSVLYMAPQYQSSVLLSDNMVLVVSRNLTADHEEPQYKVDCKSGSCSKGICDAWRELKVRNSDYTERTNIDSGGGIDVAQGDLFSITSERLVNSWSIAG